ncbi:uncharacterized protein LOC125202492 isoform X2 [Salvia hispanica]|nr:uncharacterized protein LOC125202492 isoform X2 [Salvia hispanica]XP_047956849.1 uncharacterized protein LOC125202492 isoform X2 [Salvia hispanica]XP_047956850.1 uncharacterized protein LOC125202492 isoform X2 [Salvia hispanica]
MTKRSLSDEEIFLLLEDILQKHHTRTMIIIREYLKLHNGSNRIIKNHIRRSFRRLARIPTQVRRLTRLTSLTGRDCINNLRMDRNCFGRLCILLREGAGLVDGSFVKVEEQVAIFLCVLSHHEKNRVVSFEFWRSGQTVSYYFHVVLRAIILVHKMFISKPTPVPDNSVDPRWKWFKGCLGALDGTYINVRVPLADKPRYRTRKGQIATNTLAACTRDMRFVYVLPGWEGSAGDARILRDAVARPHGIKVPKGNYYLCDNGYANSEGFLTPYRGVRYHLQEWGPDSERPKNPREMFNMRHTSARNIIERAFAILKMRWGILRSASYYPIETQTMLIMACFLLHNYIRGEMTVDPIEQLVDNNIVDNDIFAEQDDTEYVEYIDPTVDWNNRRDQMAADMWMRDERP